MDNSNNKKQFENTFFTSFLFPFKYEKQHPKISKHTETSPKELADFLKTRGWSPKLFLQENPIEYNEWHYFHPFVREMIFFVNHESATMQYLTRTDCRQIEITYGPKNNESGKTITMDITSVGLHLFENQVGILSFTASVPSQIKYTKKELLIFNDITRRVYPPFLSGDTNNSAKANRLLPLNVVLRIADREPVSEDFGSLNTSGDNISNIIRNLLDGMKYSVKGADKNEWFFESYTDDRMFVVSYLLEPNTARRLSKQSFGRYHYESDDFWYKYIFVDGDSKSVENKVMQIQLTREHTYARWVNYGTLFGMSRYSFVAVCGIDNEGKYHRILSDQMKSMYYQLALIILFQRSMLLKFSADVRDLDFTRKPDKIFLEKAKKLHGDFIRFTNAYLFSEVTPQEQGIELYDQLYKIHELDKLFVEVKQEIDDVATYIRNEISHETDASVRDLTLLLFALTMCLVLFGDFIFEGKFFHWKKALFEWNTPLFSYSVFSIAIISILLLLIIIFLLVPRLYNSVKLVFAQFWRSKTK